LALRFNIDLAGGHENDFLAQNIMRAQVGKMIVKFVGTILQDMVGYNIFQIFEDQFL